MEHLIADIFTITKCLCQDRRMKLTNRNNVRKALAICATQLAGGTLSKMLKYFQYMFQDMNLFLEAQNKN